MTLASQIGELHVCGLSVPGVEVKSETLVLGGDGSVRSSMAIVRAPSPTRWVSRSISDSDELSNSSRLCGPPVFVSRDLGRVIYFFPPDRLFCKLLRSVSIP